MTVLVEMDMPMSREVIESLGDEMGVRTHVPDGLVSHVLSETGEGCHIMDIWTSQEDFERFRDSQLVPSMMKFLQEHGMQPPEHMPDPKYTPVYDLVRGS